MGPDDPWSAAWRPDETGERRRAIRSMRRGAVVAAVVYLPVAVLASVGVVAVPGLGPAGALLGVPAVALLGAGLAPAAIGGRAWAVVTAVAFAIGAPVAAVTSLVIFGFVADSFIGDSARFGGPLLRLSVRAALGVWPAVAAAAGLWMLAVRTLDARGR